MASGPAINLGCFSPPPALPLALFFDGATTDALDLIPQAISLSPAAPSRGRQLPWSVTALSVGQGSGGCPRRGMFLAVVHPA